MHDEVYQFFNELTNVKRPATHYDEPARIWIIDNFLPANIFKEATNQISLITEWLTFENGYSNSKRKECRNLTEAPIVETIANCFNSSKTVNWLESITDSKGLIPDPHFLGGGLCTIASQSKLDLHTDFNWNNRLKLNRSVNLMLYLNEEWIEEWGGALEFWDDDKTECIQKVMPKPNRLIFWEYDTNLVHGFPNKLETPADVTRNNLIHFYYTSNSTWDEDPRRSQFINNG